MCGKYHITTEDENISFREAIAQLMLEHPEIDIKTGDILPSQAAPVYDAFGLQAMRFGHRPAFMKKLLINARSETAEASPLFGPLMKSARVLVPAQAFYEWSPAKKPCLFGRLQGGLLYMAGLAFPGEGLPGFVILTRDAAGRPAEVHPRMPLTFAGPGLRDAWPRQDGLAGEPPRLPDGEAYMERELAGQKLRFATCFRVYGKQGAYQCSRIYMVFKSEKCDSN